MTLLNIKLKSGGYLHFRGTYSFFINKDSITIIQGELEEEIALKDISTISEQIPNQKTHINAPIWNCESLQGRHKEVK